MYLFCISCKYIVATIKVPTLVSIISSQNTTNFIVLYVLCKHNYMFRPILGHLQVVSYSLESEVS